MDKVLAHCCELLRKPIYTNAHFNCQRKCFYNNRLWSLLNTQNFLREWNKRRSTTVFQNIPSKRNSLGVHCKHYTTFAKGNIRHSFVRPSSEPRFVCTLITTWTFKKNSTTYLHMYTHRNVCPKNWTTPSNVFYFVTCVYKNEQSQG